MDAAVTSYAKQQLLSELLSVGTLTESSPGVSMFLKGPDCLFSLRSILRLLVSGTSGLSVFLASLGPLQTHFLPLLVSYRDDPEVVFQLLRLLVVMTMDSEGDKDRDRGIHTEALQKYARALIDHQEAMTVLMIYLEQPLAYDVKERTPRANQLLELLLTLFKNLLEIPSANEKTSTLSNLYSLHDDLILKLQEENIIETIILLAQFAPLEKSASSTFLLLEILHSIFRLEEPANLLQSGENREKVAAESAQRIFAALNAPKPVVSSRHSNFGGAIVVKRIGGASQISSFSKKNVLPKTLATGKVSKKNVEAAQTLSKIATSNDRVRQILNSAARTFLKTGFRELMTCVFKEFELGSTQMVGADKLHFMGVASFFLEYHRLHLKLESKEKGENTFLFDASTVFCALNDRAFAWILRHVKIFLGDDPTKSMWQAVQYAVKMYKNMIISLYEMEYHGDEENKQTAELLLRNLFYDRENFDIFVSMLKFYQLSYAPKQYLKDAVEAVHYTLHILKHFGESHAHFLMLNRGRMVKKKKLEGRMVQDSSVDANNEGNHDQVGSEGAAHELSVDLIVEKDRDAAAVANMESENVQEELAQLNALDDAYFSKKEMEMNFSELLAQFMHSKVGFLCCIHPIRCCTAICCF